jgi:alpha-tubulin suppressor-like RCC1 family protein
LLKHTKLNLLFRRLLLGATVAALGATAWSTSAPNGRIAILGSDIVMLSPDGTLAVGRSELHPGPDLRGVIRIATGRRDAAALKLDGTVWTWGEGKAGPLGAGIEEDRETVRPVPGLASISGIACGDEHCLAWRIDGRAWAWGGNDHGQLGDGSTTDRQEPVSIALPPLRSAAGGRDHTLAVTMDGRVLAWGGNASGQLGRSDADESSPPLAVQGLDRIVDVSAGGSHSLALREDGTVWAWGGNEHGQLGTGDDGSHDSPIAVPALGRVTALAAGSTHSVALLADGTVWAWGSNDRGEIGDGGEAAVDSPRRIASSASAISAGDGVTAVLRTDGSILVIGSGPSTEAVTALLSGSALLVVGNTTLGTGDTAVRNRLQSLGLTVTVVKDSTATTANATGKVVVVVSSTVSPTSVNTKFRDIAVPVVTWESAIFDDMKMTGTVSGTNFGTTTNQTQVAISTPTHPLAAGLSGTVTVSASSTFDWGVVAATGVKAATIVSNTGRATDFGYEAGSTMVGMTAPARRVGLFLYDTTAASLTASGWALFDAAINWASAPPPLPTPSVAPATGTYTTSQTVTISCATCPAGTTLRYTTNGTPPTATSTAYSAPFSVSTATQVQARAFKSGWADSAAAVATYTFNYGTRTQPTIAPVSGTYVDCVQVTISASAGDEIRYTTDGSTPTQASSLYSAPFALCLTTTVKAVAFRVDWTQSAVATATYTVKVAAPTFNPGGGTYASAQDVVVSCTTAGATIHYTTTGVDPTASDPAVASGAIVHVGSATLKASAWKTGATTSDVTSAVYVVRQATIGAGSGHALAATAAGVAWAWGRNIAGEVGDGTTTPRLTAVPVLNVSDVTKVGGGDSHSVALTGAGEVWTWGRNAEGELGDGTTTNRSTPAKVSGLSSVVALETGGYHTIAVRADGTVWAVGRNDEGELAVSSLTSVRAAAAGTFYTVVLKNDGTVWGSGQNWSGQLGYEPISGAQTTPVQVGAWAGVPITGVASISATGQHVIAMKSDGTVWGWGYNWSGQLGNGQGTVNSQSTPVQASGLTSMTAVAAGGNHSLALKSDGTVWTWGNNDQGQLGRTTSQPSDPLPAQLANPTDVVAIAAGWDFSLALTSDGSIWAWGRNVEGQLGDGTTINRLQPIRIADAGFAWKTATPTFSLASGTYTAVEGVMVSCTTAGAVIHYTTNGLDPTESDPSVAPGGTVTVDVTMTLKAAAYSSARAPSNVTTAMYTLKVATPTFSPDGGTYSTPQSVIVSTTSGGGVLHYTTNGATPTESDPVVPPSGIAVDAPTTVKAAGWRTGWTPGDVGTAAYTMVVGTPILTPPGGSYAATPSVTVTSVTPGADLHYTLDGAQPTQADPTIASGSAITIPRSLTLKVVGWRAGWNTSASASGSYALSLGTVATPVLSPAPGTFTSSQTISMSTTTNGAVIRYTTDGTDPDFRSALYSSPVVIGRTTVLNAAAFASDMTPSASVGGLYVIDTGTVDPPRFSPAGGQYNSKQLVTVTTGTAGAVIHYRTDGLEPDESDPTVASGSGVLVGQSLHLTARAYKTGMTMSATVAADYRVTGAVAAGSSTTFAVKADGTVWSWGRNDFGAIGDPAVPYQGVRGTPGPVPGLTDIVAIAAGAFHGLALKADGTVWGWGRNSAGEVGDGTTTDRYGVVQVVNLANVVTIAAGGDLSIAIKRDGTLWAWGYSNVSYGVVPVEIAALRGTTAACIGGYNFALAVQTNGMPWHRLDLGQQPAGSVGRRNQRRPRHAGSGGTRRRRVRGRMVPLVCLEARRDRPGVGTRWRRPTRQRWHERLVAAERDPGSGRRHRGRRRLQERHCPESGWDVGGMGMERMGSTGRWHGNHAFDAHPGLAHASTLRGRTRAGQSRRRRARRRNALDVG